MAREIFLLGCEDSATPEAQTEALKNWTKKLGQLGVGSLAGVMPTIFRSPITPYKEIANSIAAAVGSDAESMYDIDLLDLWSPPLNRVEAAACLSASTAYALYKAGVESSRYEQRIVIAPQVISDEFLQHYPSSAYGYVQQEDPVAPMFSYIIRDINPTKITHR